MQVFLLHSCPPCDPGWCLYFQNGPGNGQMELMALRHPQMTMCTDCPDCSHPSQLLGMEVGLGYLLALLYSGHEWLGVLQFPCSNQVVANYGWDNWDEGGGKGCISTSIEAIKSRCPVWFISEIKSPTCQACSMPLPVGHTPMFLCCWQGTLQLSQQHTWSLLSYSDPKPEEQRHRMFQL